MVASFTELGLRLSALVGADLLRKLGHNQTGHRSGPLKSNYQRDDQACNFYASLEVRPSDSVRTRIYYIRLLSNPRMHEI